MRSLLRLGPLLFAACAAPEPAPVPELDPPTLERIERVERGLLPPVRVEGEPAWTLAERRRQHGVPGVSVPVIDGFELAWTKARGVADRSTGATVTTETLFQASSMSKTVTAALTLRLVEREKLALD